MVTPELKTFVLGELANNCYLLYHPTLRQALLIDCPKPFGEVRRFIEKNKLQICYVLLTHGHFDHIGGLDDCDYPFYIHAKDRDFLQEPRYNGSLFFSQNIVTVRPPHLYDDQVPLRFIDYPIRILPTPGHTPGSVSIVIDTYVFSGDTLFFDTIGRTDIPYAHSQDLLQSIRSVLFSLPDDTIVYPGHGQRTTIGREKNENPFVHV